MYGGRGFHHMDDVRSLKWKAVLGLLEIRLIPPPSIQGYTRYSNLPIYIFKKSLEFELSMLTGVLVLAPTNAVIHYRGKKIGYHSSHVIIERKNPQILHRVTWDNVSVKLSLTSPGNDILRKLTFIFSPLFLWALYLAVSF